MNASKNNLLKSFETSSDPVVLADMNARILWLNPCAQQLFKDWQKAAELADLFSFDITQQILSCEQFDTIEVFSQPTFNNALKYTAIVVCTGSGDPDDDVFLIILKPLQGASKQLLEREDAISTVTHDLKNPLGAIFGYSDALLDTKIGLGLDAKQNEIISRIRNTASRSLELVRNFQHLSQLNINDALSNLSICDINSITKTVLESTWRENPLKPKVNVDLSASSLLTKADRLQIDRSISNLYTNAIKFTPLDGEINISTFSSEKFVCFRINNNLPLIASEELSRIFERRFRAANSKGAAGSGLGLYIVKKIMDRIGGSINVESSASSGTTFIAKYPLFTSSEDNKLTEEDISARNS